MQIKKNMQIHLIQSPYHNTIIILVIINQLGKYT